MRLIFPEKVFHLTGQKEFQSLAIEIFRYQAENNIVYNQYLRVLGRDYNLVRNIEEIPFLPVEFFRSRKVMIDNLSAETVFESSATTGSAPSHHYVHDTKVYKKSFQGAFRLFYGDPEEYFIAALLPSYTERPNSSLVYMVNDLIEKSRYSESGFFSNNPEKLILKLKESQSKGRKTILLGVSFALLDLAEKHSPDLSGIIIMETGGMKGRRNEITREELHDILKTRLNVQAIHSEYGMTELLSQAYSAGGGIFYAPPWMKVLIRDPQDPLSVIQEPLSTGGINIIDLANFYSCSFISTGDLGKLHSDGGFEVLGRFDSSDVRGCNLMIV
jgi:hypothetical protein